MFSYEMVGANDLAASIRFYTAILAELGIGAAQIDPNGRAVYASSTARLMIPKPLDGRPARGANGGTIGFVANSTQQIDAWQAAGLASSGTTCEDPPGVRGSLYLAYLKDPAGNKICARMQM